MYDNENGVYLKSVEVVNQESSSKEPPAPPSTEPKDVPATKRFTEATHSKKSTGPEDPTRP